MDGEGKGMDGPINTSYKIWKIAFPILDHGQGYKFLLPRDAQPLCVQMQSEEDACVWYLVNEAKPTESRALYCVGTGIGFGGMFPYSEKGLAERYIGTVQQLCYVWHFFDWPARET